MPHDFSTSGLSQLTRRPERGSHNREAVYAILDAALVCHIGYVADGQPFATPTLFWRAGDDLYWHGSSHGRMIRTHAAGQRVCVTVSHLDALNLGRSGIASSVQYRSVMAFGMTIPITDAAEKRRQMGRLIDRKFPGRTAELRPIHDHEINQITVIRMTIEEASVKVKSGGIMERREEDYDVATWAGVIPVAMTVGAAIPDQRLLVDAELPRNVAMYRRGRRLDEALVETQESASATENGEAAGSGGAPPLRG